MRRTYTDAEKTEALSIYLTDGPTAAAEQTGIPKGTIDAWASHEGLQTVCAENTRAATETVKANHEARRTALAEKLLQIAEAGADRELELLYTSKLRDVVGSRTRAVHDLQLLTGSPTARNEHTPADRQAALADGEDRGLRLVG